MTKTKKTKIQKQQRKKVRAAKKLAQRSESFWGEGNQHKVLNNIKLCLWYLFKPKDIT